MQQTTNKKDSFTFIDLFAVIGGLRLAFESANETKASRMPR